MPPSSDVLILGGGVIGLTTAYHLARDGAKVTVLDKGDLGQEASWAGAGILPPGSPAHARSPIERLRAESAALFPALSAELRETTGIDNGYVRCGGLEFTCDAHACGADEWRTEGVACERLSESDYRALEPAVATRLGCANHLPDLAQLRNPRHIKALIAGCSAHGVRLQPGCAAFGFRLQPGQALSATTSGGEIAAGKYLISAGSWSEFLLAPLGWHPGIRPIRGQIALLNTSVPPFRRVLVSGARYLVPRSDGRVLVGSTEEDRGFLKRTTAVAIQSLLEFGVSLVPALEDAMLERCWAGLRPGSPDGLPCLGTIPGYENIFVATGHFRAGIQLSAATGLVMKQLLFGQVPFVPVESFRLDRFSGRRSAPHSG